MMLPISCRCTLKLQFSEYGVLSSPVSSTLIGEPMPVRRPSELPDTLTKPVGKRIAQVIAGREPVDASGVTGVGAVPDIAQGAFGCPQRRSVEDAEAAPHNRLPVRKHISESEARRPIGERGRELLPAATVYADRLESSHQARESRSVRPGRRRGIEYVRPGIALRQRHLQIVAQPQVQRQFQADFPFVGKIERVIPCSEVAPS